MKTKIQWNKVTWYSKIVAIVVFVATFFLGMHAGILYDQANSPCSTSNYYIPHR